MGAQADGHTEGGAGKSVTRATQPRVDAGLRRGSQLQGRVERPHGENQECLENVEVDATFVEDDSGKVRFGQNVPDVIKVLNSCGWEQEDAGGHLAGVGLGGGGQREEKSGCRCHSEIQLPSSFLKRLFIQRTETWHSVRFPARSRKPLLFFIVPDVSCLLHSPTPNH